MSLEKYSPSSLKKIKDLDRGSYGLVRLFYHKKSKKYVVGKVFDGINVNDENGIKNQFRKGEREAKILSKLKHENIVRVLGISIKEGHSFTILLEYAPCGNLKTLLQNGTEIFLPWRIRVRFFLELASALDYLHNQHPKRSNQHGDLKPENVLLGDLLTIKLADFGATSISKRPGATSLSITADGNTQHTPLYTAPEYLKNPNQQKTCSMDVYSYGMIGYEIITRKKVYSGTNAPSNIIKDWILRGEKPDLSCIDEVANALKKKRSNLAIFDELKDTVYQCWQTKAEDRPNISVVEKRLNKLAQNEQIYDRETNSQVSYLISHRKLKSSLTVHPKKQSRKMSVATKTSEKCAILQLAFFISIAVVILAVMIKRESLQPNANNAAIVFLAVEPKSLTKYEWQHNATKANVKISTLFRFPKAFEGKYSAPDFVKIHDLVFLTNFANTKSMLKTNLSDSPFQWQKINWNNEYKHRKYISYKDSILAVGSYFDYISHSKMSLDLFVRYHKTVGSIRYFQAHLYNITTNRWTQLPNMNESRVGHTLVKFKGLICAVGGFYVVSQASVECFNFSTNQWTRLPSMNTGRAYSAAVELNNELYVIGGGINNNSSSSVEEETETFLEFTMKVHNSVEKYNLVTNMWVKVDSLQKKRMCHGAGVFNGKIYVVGGYTDAVEVYDPLVKTWQIMDVLPKHRFSVGRFIAVEDSKKL